MVQTEGGPCHKQPGVRYSSVLTTWGNGCNKTWRVHFPDSSLTWLASQCWPLPGSPTGLESGSPGFSPQEPLYRPIGLLHVWGLAAKSWWSEQKGMVFWCSSIRSHIAPLLQYSVFKTVTKIYPDSRGGGTDPHHSMGGKSGSHC